ncbi:glycerophosphoryl diester phosphodiesterase membrane domain-containing protein [Natronorubrum sp. DTA7]|uniref:glycerophosphoryl diester phosphodiesterase membrane domain-containing protein n=1 Tax=Natronorubrum sp. DTA7 TaxID=3447016 RepID=UPI003F85D3EB
MSVQLHRKNSVDTMLEAFDWLKRNPILILLFLIVGFVDGLGDESVTFTLLGFLLTIVANGVAHRFAFAEARGESATIGIELDTVLGRLLSLIGATLIYAVAVTIGLILLIIPGIYLGLRLSLAFPAIVIDDENAFEGLGTSWNVAHGNLLKLLGITLLSLLVLFSTVIVATLFSVDVESFVFVALVGAIITAIVGPIVQLSYARVYLENREPASTSGAGSWDDGQSSPAGGARDDGWGAGNDDGSRDFGSGGDDRDLDGGWGTGDDGDDDRNANW